jgi:hypothetical protein
MLNDDNRKRLLELDYRTAFDTWRQMVDIRFKLLALVPIATVIGVSRNLPVGACIAGLTFVIGLTLYEIRNTQIHDALARRLVQLEASLGSDADPSDVARPSTFSDRPPGALRAFGVVRVWHNRSIGVIYGASVAAWIWRLASSLLTGRLATPLSGFLATIGSGIVGLLVYVEIVRLSEEGR